MSRARRRRLYRKRKDEMRCRDIERGLIAAVLSPWNTYIEITGGFFTFVPKQPHNLPLQPSKN